ncbi:MAG TPA: hypothetical protein DEF12_15480 [Rhodobacteraceae bacterium]|jgi:hypothetical protein|nr:hypothetical protein [Paracoccaceae bacterium]HBV56419.1 hypothetical protein [Paracoccaceae bacterium]
MFCRCVVCLAAVIATAACAAPVPPSDSCGAASLARLIGQPVADVVLGAAPSPVRVIGPNTPVTKDYRLNRLNIIHDAAGVIIDIRCG